jgi:hypothetical protein
MFLCLSSIGFGENSPTHFDRKRLVLSRDLGVVGDQTSGSRRAGQFDRGVLPKLNIRRKFQPQ